VLDGILCSKAIGERALALQHLCYSKTKDLIIYDRGYPAYDFIHQHCLNKVDFLMRVKVSFSAVTKAFIEGNTTSEIVEIYPGKNVNISEKDYHRDTAIKVRLIRVELPSGETELLITSLINSKLYPNKIFKQLYFKRWKVETFYDELKNKLKVEYFSGYSNQSILQDFYAALFISNVQTLIVSDLEEELNTQNQGKKYQYKVNTNLSYGFLKNRIIKLFFSKTDMKYIIKELKILFKQHVVPIRTNRNQHRNTNKYRRRQKPKVTKNQKDAI